VSAHVYAVLGVNAAADPIPSLQDNNFPARINQRSSRWASLSSDSDGELLSLIVLNPSDLSHSNGSP